MNRVVAVLLAATVLLAWARPTRAQEEAADGFELRPGVVISPGRGLAYVMNPKGRIDAVELARGGSVWTTKRGAKPLALVGDLLICQTEPSGASLELGLVALDTRKQGERTSAKSATMPVGAQVSIDDTLEGSFAASARAVAGDVFIFWTHTRNFVSGMAPERSEPPGGPAVRTSPRVLEGTVRWELSGGGAISLLTREDSPAAPEPRRPDLDAAQALSDLPGPQFVSADGRHVLISEAVGDPSGWNDYRWTLYERATARRVGEIKDYRSRAPFFVSGSTIVYETGPLVRRSGKELIEEPLELRAMSLETGKELWSRPIRDTAYRGPFPP
jgi:hypothetical protein